MSEAASTHWDDTMLLLQRESRNSGMLLLELARLESERAVSGRGDVWCMGRGGRSRDYQRFTWQYWTRRARRASAAVRSR